MPGKASGTPLLALVIGLTLSGGCSAKDDSPADGDGSGTSGSGPTGDAGGSSSQDDGTSSTTSTSPPDSSTGTTATSGSTTSTSDPRIWRGIYNNQVSSPYEGRFSPCGGTETYCIEYNESSYDCENMFMEVEACSLEEEEEPCGPGRLCWDSDPGATTGHCVEFCSPDFMCSGTCMPCPSNSHIALCRHDCEPPCDDGATCIR